MILLLLPLAAQAKVFMCVDAATGATVFSDRGCAATAAQEEVRVQATNVDSGSRTAEATVAKTWASERDTRKTGRDHSAERRAIKESNAAANASALTYSDES